MRRPAPISMRGVISENGPAFSGTGVKVGVGTGVGVGVGDGVDVGATPCLISTFADTLFPEMIVTIEETSFVSASSGNEI